MHKSLNIIIGDQKLLIIKISDGCCLEQWLVENIDELNSKFPEIIQNCDYDIKVLVDTSDQNFTTDTLLSTAEHGFLHSIRVNNDQSYNQSSLTGYFFIEHCNNNINENKIVTISAPKNNFITEVLDRLKTYKNSIQCISSLAVELQKICIEIKRQYVTIHYDQSEASIRTFTEYDVYAMMTTTGVVRYFIYKNDIYHSNSCTIINNFLTEDKLLDIIKNNISSLLRTLDPSINDQLNLFICLNKNQLAHFNDFASKVDRLLLIEIDKLARDLSFTLQYENTSTIDTIIATYLDYHKPITNILDLEYHKIIKFETYNKAFRWPTLFISCTLTLSIILGLATDRYFKNANSLLSNQINLISQQIKTVAKQRDHYLTQNNLDDMFKLYQEVASYETPFELLKNLIKVKSDNLEYVDIFWNNISDENIAGSIDNNITIIANIKTDNNNSFEMTINNFISSLTKLNPEYIIDYSRPTDQIVNIGNGDNNPLLIKIRCVGKK